MVRKLFIVGFLFFNLVSVPVYAADGNATSMAPEFNPMCWKRAKCEEIRRKLVGNNATALGDGFITGDSAYPCRGDADGPEGEWGKCLPANVAKTEIAFGGEKTFANLGDFLQKNYNLAIAMAGIIAAIVVILSGFQWAMSGGNAETISGAKHRITNAIIGMFIAYTSYFILNTINPDLVNLRLPQTWLLRPLATMPRYCYAAPKDESTPPQPQFALATADQNVKDIPASSNPSFILMWDNVVNGVKPDGSTEKTCGTRYWMRGGGSATCFGSFCGRGMMCSNYNPDNPDQKTYECIRGSMVGQITATYLIPPVCGLGNVADSFAGYKFPWVSTAEVNDIYKVCVDQNGNGMAMLYHLNYGFATYERPADNTTGFIFAGEPRGLDTSCPKENDSENKEIFYGFAVGLKLLRNCASNDNVVVDKYGNQLGIMADNSFLGWGGVSWISGSRKVQKTDLFTLDEINNGQTITIDAATFLPQGKF